MGARLALFWLLMMPAYLGAVVWGALVLACFLAVSPVLLMRGAPVVDAGIYGLHESYQACAQAYQDGVAEWLGLEEE